MFNRSRAKRIGLFHVTCERNAIVELCIHFVLGLAAEARVR